MLGKEQFSECGVYWLCNVLLVACEASCNILGFCKAWAEFFFSMVNRKFIPQAFGGKSRVELLADTAKEEAL